MNQKVQHIHFDCRSTLTVLPCFGYILIGDELLATFPQSIRNMLPSERCPYCVDDGAVAVTTVWQLLMNQYHHHQEGAFDIQLVSNLRVATWARRGGPLRLPRGLRPRRPRRRQGWPVRRGAAR